MVDLAGLVLAEADDALRGLGQLLVEGNFLALGAQSPDPAGIEVAVDIGAHEVRQPAAAVNIAAGQAAEIGMRMLDHGREDGRWSFLALGPEGVIALVDAPAVIAAPLDLVDHLPEVLTNLAHPQVAGG